MILDKELEAMVKCTSLLEDVDQAGRFRVIKYLVDRFNIQQSSGHQPQLNSETSRQSSTSFESPAVDADDESNEENAIIDLDDQDTVYEDILDFPTLNDLMIKDYPKTEAEWMLCFGFYSSEFGNSTFSKDDLRERYREIDRYTKSNRNNFNNNLAACIRRDWFKSVNDGKLIMKIEGNEYAKKIIDGKSEANERKQSKRKKIRS